MKLAFSTLGCPEWTFDQILDAAQRLGYDGIEFRGILDQLDLVNVPEFSPAQIAATRKRLDDAGVRVACMSSSICVVASTKSEVDRFQAIEHAKRYIELAKEMGAPCIRLFSGDVPATLERDAALDRAADSLRKIGDYATERGVIAAVETHDAFVRSEQLMEMIRLAHHPAAQVLWDIHNPYREAGETIAHSLHYLGGHIASTHVKDSLAGPEGDGSYVLLGRGDVPVLDAIRALTKAGYDGFYTLEWERRWVPQLDPPEIAFPQYVEQMKAWMTQL